MSVMGLNENRRYTSTIININLKDSFVIDCGLKSNYMYWWEEYFTKFQKLYDDINSKSYCLNKNISTGNELNTLLTDNFEIGNELYQNISNSISNATVQNNNLITNNNIAETNCSNLVDENATANENITALTSANFDANEILNGVEDIKSYIGYTDSDILGLQVDLENKTFTRLAGAVGLTAGNDFDQFNMFGGRKRCCVADDGTINAWYGDNDYIEDGSNGQVMVYQPKFYYRVVPLKIEPITNGIGYHLRKANYYVSDTFKTGFKIHPAFIDKNSDEIDYILFSAYEGSIYDSSENQYITDDAQIMDIENDKLCSIVNVKPSSGTTQLFTRENAEKLSQNRGDGWHIDLIKTLSANQLLMIIELASMNVQNTLGPGVTEILEGETDTNNSLLTGSDFEQNNTYGQNSILYRNVENPWGNIWKFINGINLHGDGNNLGGIPYICDNLNFFENKNTDNYKSAGFYLANNSGFISAIGYSENYDYLFLPTETIGNSTLPIGDYSYMSPHLTMYRNFVQGGFWKFSSYAGLFTWYLNISYDKSSTSLGARLVYIPTKN